MASSREASTKTHQQHFWHRPPTTGQINAPGSVLTNLCFTSGATKSRSSTARTAQAIGCKPARCRPQGKQNGDGKQAWCAWRKSLSFIKLASGPMLAAGTTGAIRPLIG